MEVAVATVVTADLQLELGATSESVTVSAEATRLESSSSELGYTVSTEDYHEWPVSSNDDGQRQIQSFIFNSLPGTSGDSYLGSINGSPTGTQEVYIEGISIGRADVAGDIAEYTPSVDAVSEFRLQTGALSAAYGGGLTAVANFNSQVRHQSVARHRLRLRDERRLNANSFDNNAFGTPKSPFKQNSFGGDVGGRLCSPSSITAGIRLSGSSATRAIASATAYVSGYRTVPTAAFKQGDFSALPQTIYDPNSTVQLPDGSYSRSAIPRQHHSAAGYQSGIEEHPEGGADSRPDPAGASAEHAAHQQPADLQSEHFHREVRPDHHRQSEAVVLLATTTACATTAAAGAICQYRATDQLVARPAGHPRHDDPRRIRLDHHPDPAEPPRRRLQRLRQPAVSSTGQDWPADRLDGRATTTFPYIVQAGTTALKAAR